MTRPMHLRWYVALACVAGLLAGTVWQAPAQWWAMAAAHATHGQLQLLNVRGTLWGGQAHLVLTGGAASLDRQALPGALRWQLRPAWASGPALQLSLRADCCVTEPVRLLLSYRQGGATLAVSDHQSLWPAGLLAGLGAPWNTIQLQGRLALNTSGLALHWHHGVPGLSGQAALDLQGTSSALTPFRPLGDYRLRIESPEPGGQMAIELRTLQGALTLTGDGRWDGGRLRFRGTAEAHPDHVDALSNLLNVLGQRDGARARLSWG